VLGFAKFAIILASNALLELINKIVPVVSLPCIEALIQLLTLAIVILDILMLVLSYAILANII
jgi:hypothetical protein